MKSFFNALSLVPIFKTALPAEKVQKDALTEANESIDNDKKGNENLPRVTKIIHVSTPIAPPPDVAE